MNKRTLLSVIAIVLLAVGGGYMLWNQQGFTLPTWEDGQSQTEEAETESSFTDNEQINQEKRRRSQNQDPQDQEPSSGESADDENSDAEEDKGSVTPTISTLEQDDENDQIRVRAYAEVDQEGTCILTMTKDGHTLKRQSGTTLQPSYYLCNGFEVPVSDFPESGVWQTVVRYEAEDVAGSSQTKEIDIQK